MRSTASTGLRPATWRILVMLTVLALFSLSLAACSSDSDGAGDNNPISVGSILDITGDLSQYGVSMDAAQKLAIDDINKNGGVLGRQLELTSLDSQSDINRYSVQARQLANSDAAVVMGGITSASREAIRPIFDNAKKLYFYNVLYEGGVCDKNTFIVGETPSQQLGPLLEWTVDQGLTKWYLLAADYNYGQISSQWVETYADQYGAEIVGGPTFFDLSVNDFSSELPKIQSSGADTIVSMLVGGAHLNFFKQWAATGLNESTTIVSANYGFGSEQVALGPDGKDIKVTFPYFQELDTPASQEFVKLWQDSGQTDPITPGAASTWVAWHLWASAVEKAGTLDRDKVIAALESGLSYDGPGGTVQIDPGSHHVIEPMRLWSGDGTGGWDLVTTLSESAAPTFEQTECDLVNNPDINQQFTP